MPSQVRLLAINDSQQEMICNRMYVALSSAGVGSHDITRITSA